MKFLIDFHHPDLYESFLLTLEDRLGYEVYRPIGMEWWNEGYWNFERWAGDGKANIFLSPDPVLDIPGDYYNVRPDVRHPGRSIKLVTLEQARSQSWDIIMSTVPENSSGFARFAGEVGARYAHQLGNNEHTLNYHYRPLLLISTKRAVPDGLRGVNYDQELDTRLFFPTPVPMGGPISSLVLIWHNSDLVRQLWNYCNEHVRGVAFNMYGSEGENLWTTRDVAQVTRAASAIWHTKPIGDGWGHVIHGAAACGRPLLGYKSFYKGMVGERLWTHDNALLFDNLTKEDIVKHLRLLMRDHDRLLKMGEASRAIWDKHIDYARDAENIRRLFEE